MTIRQQEAMKIFIREGRSIKGAAAIVGALSGESGINLDSTVFRIKADHGSGGIAEWRLNRKTNMIAFIKVRGKPINDLESQCLFVIHELENGEEGNNPYQYRYLNEELIQGRKTIENLCWNFVTKYERPNMAVAHMDNRVRQAEKAYNQYRLNQRGDGVLVAGGVSGIGAVLSGIMGAPPVLIIGFAIAGLVGWILYKLANRDEIEHIPSALPTTLGKQAVTSPLENFKLALEKVRAAQIEANKAREVLVAQAEEMKELIDSMPIVSIDLTPNINGVQNDQIPEKSTTE